MKKLKGIGKETRKVFAESAVLVMLEDMHDDIKLIAEGHSSLTQSLEEVKTELSEFKVNTEKNFQTVFEYLSRIDEELIDIRGEIKDLRRELKNKADLDRLEKLEKRMVIIEKRQKSLAVVAR